MALLCAPKHIVDLDYRVTPEMMEIWHHPDCEWRVRVRGADRTPGCKCFWHFIRYYEVEPPPPYNVKDFDDEQFETQGLNDFKAGPGV